MHLKIYDTIHPTELNINMGDYSNLNSLLINEIQVLNPRFIKVLILLRP